MGHPDPAYFLVRKGNTVSGLTHLLHLHWGFSLLTASLLGRLSSGRNGIKGTTAHPANITVTKNGARREVIHLTLIFGGASAY
jgi:hypothetical protein